MTILDPKQANGRTADLEGTAVTMRRTDHKCICAPVTLYRSTLKIYCYRCGVWWWADKVEDEEGKAK